MKTAYLLTQVAQLNFRLIGFGFGLAYGQFALNGDGGGVAVRKKERGLRAERGRQRAFLMRATF